MERYLIPNILPTLANLQRDDQLNWAGDRGPLRRSKNDSSDPAIPSFSKVFYTRLLPHMAWALILLKKDDIP